MPYEDEMEKYVMEDSTNYVSKSIEFEVTIDSKILFDYSVYHAYTGGAGLLATCFGAIGIILFVTTRYPLYLIFGLLILVYVPLSLKKSTAQTVRRVKTYQKPLKYLLDSEGIHVSQDEVSNTIPWENCIKAVSTKQSIVVYTGKRIASIFPRKQLGDNLPALIAVLCENMDAKKIKIRY